MPKYIDPDLLAKELERRRLSTGRLVQWQAAMEAATVEVPDAILCKDCKWWDKEQSVDDFNGFCTNLGACTNPEWYCADGERREDSEEEEK